MRLIQNNISWLWIAVLCLASCTTGSLLPVEREELLERQKLLAEVCAPAATEEDVPYRILFVIDTSLSNAWTDPDGRREVAVRNAITSLLGNQAVSFGIITYSDEPRRQTFGFTRDLDILDGATENVSNAQGGTNYSDTLWTVIDFIKDDVATMSVTAAARTHYHVFWLSDGFPTVGVTDPTALLPSVDYLLEQVADKVAELRFNTAFLGADENAPGADADAAKGLLETLAMRGDGDFTHIPAGESFEFEIDTQPVLGHFVFTHAVVSNRHTLFGANGPMADSDADGIADDIEALLETDPSDDDSDDDGFRDGIELLAPEAYDPTRFDPGCSNPELDTDLDGLRDCEEKIAGTLPLHPDSDGDFMLDSNEVFLGTSAVLSDTSFDDDLDNISNQDEIRYHLDPMLPNTAEEVKQWAYRYEVEELPREDMEQPACYQLRIENLAMVETLKDQNHPRGGNVFEVVVAFRGVSTTRFVKAQLRGRVLLERDLFDPPHGLFELNNENFVNLY